MENQNKLHMVGSVPQLFETLDGIVESNSGLRSKALWGVGVFVLTAIGLGFSVNGDVAVGIVVFGLLAISALCYALYQNSKTISEERFPFLREFLAILEGDAQAKKGFDITLDLQASDISSKQTNHESSFFSAVSVTTYVDPWFNGVVKLSDGNTMDVSVESTLVVKAKKKRKRTKRRTKGRTKVSIKLKVAPKAYKGIAPGDDLVGTIVGGLDVASIQVVSGLIRCSAAVRTPKLDTAKPVLSLMSALYSLLIPLERKARKKSQKATA